MYKTWILIIFFMMMLFSSSGYAEETDKSWKGAVSEADLVTVVNFLINNKGGEIVLAGEKHTITGKEKLDIEIIAHSCCEPKRFYKDISAYGEVKNFKFPSYRVGVPADEIPKMDELGEVQEIKFEPEKRDFWMKAIQQ
ncbi:MAG: hypothetical protein KKH29_01835 [Candidatus Omnitrophica bacterium]|nr:hypothetical protein [Candidatus Omnitrophota bacterium]